MYQSSPFLQLTIPQSSFPPEPLEVTRFLTNYLYGSAHTFQEDVKLSLSWWSLPSASSHINLIVFLMKCSFLLEKVFQAFPNILLAIFSTSALEFIWSTSHIKFVMTVSHLWLHISIWVFYYRHNKLPLTLWIDDNWCIILLFWWI